MLLLVFQKVLLPVHWILIIEEFSNLRARVFYLDAINVDVTLYFLAPHFLHHMVLRVCFSSMMFFLCSFTFFFKYQLLTLRIYYPFSLAYSTLLLSSLLISILNEFSMFFFFNLMGCKLIKELQASHIEERKWFFHLPLDITHQISIDQINARKLLVT